MELEIENLAGLDNAPQAGELKSTSVPTDTPSNNYNTKKQWNNNGNKQWNNKPQINLWDDINIDPIKFEFLKMVTDNTVKTFSIGYNIRAAEPIPEDKIKALRLATKVLLERGFRCRSWLGVDPVAQEISKEFESKPTMIDYFMLTKKHNPAIQAPVSFTNKKMGFQLAKGFSKVYDKIPNIVRAITARDIEVCLGGDFNKPLNCLIVYIKGGHERLNKDWDTIRQDGNMGNLVKMATDLQIPVFNIDTPSFGERFKQYVETGKYISHFQYESRKGKYDHKLNVDKPEVIAGVEENNGSVIDGMDKKEMEIQVQPTAPVIENKEAVKVEEPNPVPVTEVATETTQPSVPVTPETTNQPVQPEEVKQATPGDTDVLNDIGITL